MAYENDLNLKATELRLGLPGTEDENEEKELTGVRTNNKRPLPETSEECGSKCHNAQHVNTDAAPPAK